MKIDVTKSVQDNLLALIKDANPSASQLSFANITLGQVSLLSGGTGNRNSQLTVTAIANMGFSGTQVVRFRRLLVTEGVAVVPAAVSINPSDTQAQRVTKVAQALGLIESQVTIVKVGGGDIPNPANEDDTSVKVTVTPITNSSLYQGAPLTIQITTPDVDVPLGQVITNQDLNGFDPVTA